MLTHMETVVVVLKWVIVLHEDGEKEVDRGSKTCPRSLIW